MNARTDNLDRLLERVAAGELDALSLDEIGRLEQHLNENDQAAERLAAASTGRLPALAGLPPASPTADQWAGVWSGVRTAASQRAGPRAPHPSRITRLFGIAAAAAACLIAALTWPTTPIARQAEWSLEIAETVQVDELEVFDVTPTIYYNSQGGVALISLRSDEGT